MRPQLDFKDFAQRARVLRADGWFDMNLEGEWSQRFNDCEPVPLRVLSLVLFVDMGIQPDVAATVFTAVRIRRMMETRFANGAIFDPKTRGAGGSGCGSPGPRMTSTSARSSRRS